MFRGQTIWNQVIRKKFSLAQSRDRREGSKKEREKEKEKRKKLKEEGKKGKRFLKSR